MIIVGGEALIDLVLDEITTPTPSQTPHVATPTAPTEVGSFPKSALPVSEGTVSTILLYHGTVGGGPLNAAVTAARLGADVYFYGCMSQDVQGATILKTLESSHVNTSLVQTSNSPSMFALVTLDDNKNAKYNFYLSGIADADVQYLPTWERFPDIVVVGGLGLVLHQAAETYERLITSAVEKGKISLVDPNIRPAAISDPESFILRLQRIFTQAVIIKLSDDDLSWLIGSLTESNIRYWLDNILHAESVTAAVIITHGQDGIRVITRKYDLRIPAQKTTVADTIGAGDSITGSLAAWLDSHGVRTAEHIDALTEQQWLTILLWCSQIAAITVSRVGANPPWHHELS